VLVARSSAALSSGAVSLKKLPPPISHPVDTSRDAEEITPLPTGTDELMKMRAPFSKRASFLAHQYEECSSDISGPAVFGLTVESLTGEF
jgi:hypothetical protein